MDYAAILQLSAAAIASLLVTYLIGSVTVAILMIGATYPTWAGIYRPDPVSVRIGPTIHRWATDRTAQRSFKQLWRAPRKLFARLFIGISQSLADIGNLVLLPPELKTADASLVRFASEMLQSVKRAAVCLLLASLPFTAVFLQVIYQSAQHAAANVQAGEEATPLKYLGIEALTIRGEPAHVTWISSRAPSTPYPTIQRCIYLGREGNDLVLFGVDNGGSVIRLPADAVMIESARKSQGGCMS
jgi:hypothetical protein